MKAASNMTPHVQKNTGHGIPRLLPGNGDSPTAGRKNTQAIPVAVLVMRRLRWEPDACEVSICTKPPNDAAHRPGAKGVQNETAMPAPGSCGADGWAVLRS